jgi:hypothetical protein
MSKEMRKLRLLERRIDSYLRDNGFASIDEAIALLNDTQIDEMDLLLEEKEKLLKAVYEQQNGSSENIIFMSEYRKELEGGE